MNFQLLTVYFIDIEMNTSEPFEILLKKPYIVQLLYIGWF